MKKLIALVLLVLGLAVLTSPAALGARTADAKDKQRTTVGVRTSGARQADNRGRYDYEIAPRKAREDFIAVYNYANSPVTVRLLPRDASTTADGDFAAQPSADRPLDVGKWIAIADPVLTVKPRTMRIVPFQIGVPYNATPGDHVGAIVVSLLTKVPGKGTGVVVEHRVGLRVYLRVPGELAPRLSIEHLRSTFAGGLTAFGLGRTRVSYEVHNTGNIRLSASQVVRLSRAFGLPDAASVTPGKITELLPGSRIRVTEQLGRHWAIGSLTTRVTLGPKSPDKGAASIPAVHATSSRTVIPWALVLILIALLGLAYGYRRRRGRRKPVVDDAGPSSETVLHPEPALVRQAADPGRHLSKHAAQRAPKKSPRKSPRKSSRRSHRGGVGASTLGVVALLAFGTVLAPGSAGRAEAAGAPIWKATVSQKSGTDDQPFAIDTSGACPAPSRNVIGRVFGHGFPAEGVNVVGNSSGGVSQDGAFEMPLQQTLRDTMVQQPRYTPFSGVYTIVIRCILPAYVARSYGDYVAKIRFTDQHHWVALPPVTDVVGPHRNPDGSMTGPSSPGHPGTVTPAHRPTAAPKAGSGKGGHDPQGGSSSTAAAGPQSSTTADSSSGSSRWPAVILIGGGLLIGAATLLLLRRGRSET